MPTETGEYTVPVEDYVYTEGYAAIRSEREAEFVVLVRRIIDQTDTHIGCLTRDQSGKEWR